MANVSPMRYSGRRWSAILLGVVLVAGACSAQPPDRRTVYDTVTAASAGPFRIVAVGDIACAPGAEVTATTCRQAATARVARSLAPSAVVPLGDLQYERGSLADFRRSYDVSWGPLKGITKPLPGNHEYKTPGAAGYYDYFGRTAPGYFAWNAGRWRVYNLNTECSVIDCDREARWLAADLAANPRRCQVIALHRPRFSSGEHGNDPTVARFWRIAYQHRVDIALAGHDHDYERFVRLSPSGERRPARGIRSFVVGTGGKSLYAMGTRKAGSAYFQAARFGVLALDLGAGAYAWQYRTIDGVVRDRGRSDCL